MFGLTPKELTFLKRLSSPEKIQDYLDSLAINHEKQGDTCRSPRLVMREKKAHCIEGALLAATALWLQGQEPLLMDLRTTRDDMDHVVALFKKKGYWGAISKTNHAVLRYRDPLYRTPRELALSYFHEYFLPKTGEKTLRHYSRPFSLKRFGIDWIVSEENLWNIPVALDDSPHYPLIAKGLTRSLRKASFLERKASGIAEWPKKDSRT